MTMRIIVVLILVCLCQAAQAQSPPKKLWDKTLGGADFDRCYVIQPAQDGGWLLAGRSNSSTGGDKSEMARGETDYWIVRVDAQGNKLWDKTFGGINVEECYDVWPAQDGGWLLGGLSWSGVSFDKSEPTRGEADVWVVRIDAAGNKLWDKTLGGNDKDRGYTVASASDGGWLIGGYSNSDASGDKSSASYGNEDYWIVRLDVNGRKLWDKSFGGNRAERCNTLIPISDDGWLLVGSSQSGVNGNKTAPNKGNSDIWIVRIDSTGNKLWDKTYGGEDSEDCSSVAPASNGGWLLAGISISGASGDKTEASRGDYDYWVIRIDSLGNKLWDKTFGGIGNDACTAISADSDGGWWLLGNSNSGAEGDKTEISRGDTDYWLVRIDSTGNKLWDKTYGGSSFDFSFGISFDTTSGWLVAGSSISGQSGDKSTLSRGNYDYWIIRLGPEEPTSASRPPAPALTLYPNPTRDFLRLDAAPVPLKGEARILDLTGRVEQTQILTGAEIDVRALPAGHYVLEVNGQAARFVKE